MGNESERAGGEMPDTNFYAQSLLVSNPLIEPTVRSAIQALQFPVGSRGLDAGCGIGLQSLLLAEAVGPTGHVTGLDLSPEFVARARKTARESVMANRITFQEGDANQLPFDDDTFDWAWSKDCVGYHPGDSLPALRELARVVKPGGSVAILAWSSQQLLPGFPLLEARLNVTPAGIAPFVEGMSPKCHLLRSLGRLRDAGLEKLTARAFAGSVHAPLSDDLRSALRALFQMRWGSAESEVSREDWTEYQRLCQPESPDFILNLPDYYAFFIYSLFLGKVVLIR